MCPKSNHTTKTRHHFFLNPYEHQAFTRCPQCNNKTKLRIFPLVIHIDPRQLLCINKRCKYCEACDLIIAKRVEVESLMTTCCENNDPSVIGNKYHVVGTLSKEAWNRHGKKTTYAENVTLPPKIGPGAMRGFRNIMWLRCRAFEG
jgi:hypothetical protein